MGMRYLFLLYGDGEMAPGARLCGVESATTVRLRSGRVLTTDGPIAASEGIAALSGYYLADCRDLDEALEAAVRLPAAASGAVEIRPVSSSEDVGGE